MKQTALPMFARMEASISSTMPNTPSTKPKELVNQTNTEDRVMIVPAFLMKLQPRSHVPRSTFFTVGR